MDTKRLVALLAGMFVIALVLAPGCSSSKIRALDQRQQRVRAWLILLWSGWSFSRADRARDGTIKGAT
ncbi:MAG TPA: hypothetical protein VIK02_05640 [Candidatus Anoxymicrobiaceae bacterium]